MMQGGTQVLTAAQSQLLRLEVATVAVGAGYIPNIFAATTDDGSGDPSGKAPVPEWEITQIERDGDAIWIEASGSNGSITVAANVTREGDTLILSRAHFDGPGANALGIRSLRALVRVFGRREGVKKIIIEGGERTTGANPGKVPRPIEIVLE
jgi:hypothetical protein